MVHAQIPALTSSNAERLGNGALVRYRAMVSHRQSRTKPYLQGNAQYQSM